MTNFEPASLAQDRESTTRDEQQSHDVDGMLAVPMVVHNACCECP